MVALEWKRCGDDGHFCSFKNLNLKSITSDGGIYIIWHEGYPSRVVKVGQTGNFPIRFSAHRNDNEIMYYEKYGLRVTWADVPEYLRDGIERYLADRLSPLVGDAYPDVLPLAVNSPW